MSETTKIGTSVEDQPSMDERGPRLLKIRAKVLFLSLEPLLGPVEITKYLATGQIGWVICGGES